MKRTDSYHQQVISWAGLTGQSGFRFIHGAFVTAMLLAFIQPLRAGPDASLAVGGWDLEYTSRNLPLAVNSAVNIGTFNFTGAAAGCLKITVNVSANSYSVSKQYMLPMTWASLTANTWFSVLPTVSTGIYNNNDFALDVMSPAASQLALRLRTTNSDGLHAGVADIVVESIGVGSIAFSGTSAAVSAPTAQFPGNVLTQLRGNVGLGSAPANDAVLDINGGDTKGLRLRPRSVPGAPATGTWSVGTMIMDSTTTLYVCTFAGTPGQWKKVGAP